MFVQTYTLKTNTCIYRRGSRILPQIVDVAQCKVNRATSTIYRKILFKTRPKVGSPGAFSPCLESINN